MALAVALVFIGALLARSVLLAQPRPIFFYEIYFAGAVLDACGMGFTEYEAGHSPPVLDDFLARRTSSLSCDALPGDSPRGPAGWLAVGHRYLAWTMTALWRLRGVDWSALSPMFQLASGLVAALAFAIGRLGMNRVWASVLALAVTTSGLNLGYLTWFRDYSKAPFLLASLALCGWLVTRVRTTRGLLVISVVQGLVIGIGFGFRTDVLVAVPLFVLVVAGLLPREGGWTMKWRAAALAAFVLAFVVAGWPVLRGYGKGANLSHVVLLGLAQPFDKPLGVAPAHYVVNPTYWDYQTEVQTRTYVRASGGDDWAAVSTVPYDRATTRYLRAIATALPADMLARAYAAILTTFRMPSWPATIQECNTLRGTFAGTACSVHDQILRPLRTLPLLPACVFIIVLVAVPIRLAAFLVASVVVYAGSAMLQYDPRHTFHLEIVPLWTIAFAGQYLGSVARGVRHLFMTGWEARRTYARRWAPRAALAAAALVALPSCVLMLARVAQDRELSTLLARYESVEVEPLEMTWHDPKPDIRRFSLDEIVSGFGPWSPGQPTVQAEILRITLGGAECEGRNVVMTLPYRTTFEPGGVSVPAVLQWRVPQGGDTSQIFLPVYRALVGKPTETRPTGEFVTPGIDIAAADEPCVQSIGRVQDPAMFPLQFAVEVTSDWRDRPHHQRLGALGGSVTPP
jgi:hypothetical protein